MDGLTDGERNGRTDGWMDGWMDIVGYVKKFVNAAMNFVCSKWIQFAFVVEDERELLTYI